LNKWAVTLAAFVALALPEVASAWSFTVSGSARCDAQTGEYVISWKVDNSGESEDLTITASNRAAVSGTVPAGKSASYSERLPGTSGDQSLTVSGNWPKERGGYTSSTSVSLSGDCAKPPEDVCPNIDGVQTTVPPGMVKDANGNCVTPSPPSPPPMSDDCPNIPGIQGSVPEGMTKDANGDCVQRTPASPSPSDVCPNLAGVQSDVPAGMTKDSSGNCVAPAPASTPTPQAASTLAPAQPAAPATPAQPVKSGVKAEVKTKSAKKAKAKAKVKVKVKAKAKRTVKKKKKSAGGTLPITK
jgi:hypothetical protein